MTVTRAIAATAVLTGLAVGAASSVWADPHDPGTPTHQMSGHYIMTETTNAGQTLDADWYFTPCGDGCAQITNIPNASQARLVNGQWTMDVPNNTAVCKDGSQVPGAIDAHYSWDANTFAGTAQVTNKKAECGSAQGATFTDTIQLKQAP
jgi:hypothetical protein